MSIVKFLHRYIRKIKTSAQAETYRIEALVWSHQPTGLDFESIVMDIEAILADELQNDINPDKPDEYTYTIDYENDEYITLEISYFPTEELLDWQEQKQRMHSEKQGIRADRIRVVLTCSRPEPVDRVSEYLSTTDEYRVVFDRYS